MLLFVDFLIDFFVFQSIYIIFASPNTKLTYGVTVALQILDLSVQVRILVSQLKRPVINADNRAFAYFFASSSTAFFTASSSLNSIGKNPASPSIFLDMYAFRRIRMKFADCLISFGTALTPFSSA